MASATGSDPRSHKQIVAQAIHEPPDCPAIAVKLSNRSLRTSTDSPRQMQMSCAHPAGRQDKVAKRRKLRVQPIDPLFQLPVGNQALE
jgi:hypothetical protein